MEEIWKNKIRALEEENKKLKEENKQLRRKARGSNDDSKNNSENDLGLGFGFDLSDKSSPVLNDDFGSNLENTAPSQAPAVTMTRPSFMVTERFKAFGFGLKRLEWKLKARVDQSWADNL